MSSFRLAIPLFLPLVVGLALLTELRCAACRDGASYAADGGLLVTSDKTRRPPGLDDVQKDCALWRAFRGRPVCKERRATKDPYNVDYTQPQRMVSEDGVQYAPPVAGLADAPAASWTRGLQERAGAAAPSVPVTAVADAAPDPAPTAAAPAASKPKKAKTARSVKKPSRDQAAPAF